MKIRIQIVFACLAVATFSLSQTENSTRIDLPANFGSLADFQHEIKEELIASDWEALYEKMSPAYRSNITRELFLREIEEEKISIDDLRFQNTQSFEGAGYSVYGCAASYDGTEKVFFDAVFYSKGEDGVWYLETFSFSQNLTIKYGGTIPHGLRNGIRKTNEN